MLGGSHSIPPNAMCPEFRRPQGPTANYFNTERVAGHSGERYGALRRFLEWSRSGGEHREASQSGCGSAVCSTFTATERVPVALARHASILNIDRFRSSCQPSPSRITDAGQFGSRDRPRWAESRRILAAISVSRGRSLAVPSALPDRAIRGHRPQSWVPDSPGDLSL